MNNKDRFLPLMFTLFCLSVTAFIGLYLLYISVTVSTVVIN